MSIKWIIIVFMSSLVVCSVHAMNYDHVTLTFDVDNKHNTAISVDYTLNDREQQLFRLVNESTYKLGKSLLGLHDDGKTGNFNFTTDHVSHWAEDNGTRVLLVDGFYFDNQDWRRGRLPVNTEVEEFVSNSPLRSIFSPDFRPDKVTVIWPGGESDTVENVTYLPNLMRRYPSG